ESLGEELHVQVFCEQGGYYIADRAIPSKIDLTPKEVLSVRLSLTSGPVNKSGPFSEYALSAWKKIESALTGDTLQSVQSAVARHSIFTPSLSDTDCNSEIVTCIAGAIEHNKRLSVVYCSHHSGETKTLTIDPYALVFRRHNWYLVAHSHSHNKVIQLKLVRIIKAEDSGTVFQVPSDFSVDSFYAKSWEMWTGGEEQLVKVWFSPRVSRIIKEGKHHPTQQIEELPDGSVIFSVQVVGTEEIGFWILSWGADAEVLEPVELKEAIYNTAKKMVETYACQSE
ncbi:MAG TPA: WYL domain-containing protein, partial [Armatimonadota bacterium]|nr:WYL domain-containing protein [Armatimonadota bacterium]